MKSFSKEAKIGVVTVISLVLLYIGINYLKGINLFKPVNHYYVKFDNVKEVTVSSPVFIDGFKVGLVRSITYNYETTDDITVEISLDEGMRLNKGSYITIVKSLLSGGELHIHLNKNQTEYYRSGDTLTGKMGDDMLESIQERILPSVEALIPKIDSILGGLEYLVNHPALAQSLSHIEKSTSSLEHSSRQLNSLLNNLNNEVPVIMGNFRGMSENFNALSDELKVLNLTATVNSINRTLDNLTLTTEKLNRTDNSFGLLLNDRQLYDGLNNTLDSATDLLQDLKANPKRYVRLSLF